MQFLCSSHIKYGGLNPVVAGGTRKEATDFKPDNQIWKESLVDGFLREHILVELKTYPAKFRELKHGTGCRLAGGEACDQ